MRKYLTAAVAAVAALSVTAVAIAQEDPGASLDVKVTPKNAGTRTMPTNAAIDLKVVNDDFTQTASRIEIWLPRTVKLNTRGLRKCNLDALALSAAACGRAQRAGGGEAIARAGVSRNGVYVPNPPELPFKVTAYVASPRSNFDHLRGADLAFYLQQKDADGRVIPGGITAVAPAFLSRASGRYGSKLTVRIPEEPAQQYPEGQYNGLESLTAKITKRSGRYKLVSTTGCVRRKHPFKMALTFVKNPNPPTNAKITVTDNAPCTK